MSKLNPPVVVGTLTPCNDSVRARFLVIGATAEIRQGGTPVGAGTVTWPEQSISLNAGVTLTTGKAVTVTQSLTGLTTSDPSAAVVVDALPTPAALKAGQFFKPFHFCAQCVWLYDLSPGATVEVVSNGTPIGKARVGDDGQAHVDLIRPLGGDDNLVARLTACNGAKTPAATPIVGGRPAQPPSPLPVPTLQPPLACDRFVHVSGIVPGAQLTIWRGGARIGTFCSALPGFTVAPIDKLKPLPTDDALAAQQALPPDPCRLKSPKTPAAPVIDKKLDPPTILAPLCEGQTFVQIDQLRPGAMVEVQVNGAALVFGSSTPFAKITTPPLIAGTTVMARQNTCGGAADWSAWSPSTMQVGSSKPVKPLPTAPTNGATGMAVKPTLFWADPGSICNAATSFDVQVARDAGFSVGVQNFGSVTSHSWTLPAALPNSTRHFWRVKAHRGSLVSAWSTPFSFTTVAAGTRPKPGGGGGNDNDVVRDRCFVEDCCPLYRRVITVSGTYNDAYAKAVKQAGSTCTVSPLEVPCNSKVPPCS